MLRTLCVCLRWLFTLCVDFVLCYFVFVYFVCTLVFSCGALRGLCTVFVCVGLFTVGVFYFGVLLRVYYAFVTLLFWCVVALILFTFVVYCMCTLVCLLCFYVGVVLRWWFKVCADVVCTVGLYVVFVCTLVGYAGVFTLCFTFGVIR